MHTLYDRQLRECYRVGEGRGEGEGVDAVVGEGGVCGCEEGAPGGGVGEGDGAVDAGAVVVVEVLAGGVVGLADVDVAGSGGIGWGGSGGGGG